MQVFAMPEVIVPVLTETGGGNHRLYKPHMLSFIMKAGDIMNLSSEDLLAISNLLDMKLQPIKDELKMVRADILENNVIPRLNTIENCYLSTYNRYATNAVKMEALQADVDILKKVVTEHSEKLQKIS